jgi:hypothetical protein
MHWVVQDLGTSNSRTHNNFEPLWVKETRCSFKTLGYDPKCCGCTTIPRDRRNVAEGLQDFYVLNMKIRNINVIRTGKQLKRIREYKILSIQG